MLLPEEWRGEEEEEEEELVLVSCIYRGSIRPGCVSTMIHSPLT